MSRHSRGTSKCRLHLREYRGTCDLPAGLVKVCQSCSGRRRVCVLGSQVM